MKKLVSLLVVLGLAAAVNAVVVDDFQSYANDAALNAAWTVAGNTGTVLSLQNESGDQSMKIWYPDEWPDGFAQAKFLLPGAVWNTSGVSWNSYTDIDFKYKITDLGLVNWGADYGMSIKIFDCWGDQIAYKVFDKGLAVTNGWVDCDLNLAAIQTGYNYGSVGMVAFAAQGTYLWTDGAGGDLWINDITVPEPATMVLLALGGLLLRKRS